MALKYYLLDTKAAEYPAIIEALTVEFHKTWPLNTLSIVLNKDGSKALVKMDWGKQPTEWAKTGTDDPKNVNLTKIKLMDYVKELHDDVVKLLQDPKWDNTREAAGDVKPAEQLPK